MVKDMASYTKKLSLWCAGIVEGFCFDKLRYLFRKVEWCVRTRGIFMFGSNVYFRL